MLIFRQLIGVIHIVAYSRKYKNTFLFFYDDLCMHVHVLYILESLRSQAAQTGNKESIPIHTNSHLRIYDYLTQRRRQQHYELPKCCHLNYSH